MRRTATTLLLLLMMALSLAAPAAASPAADMTAATQIVDKAITQASQGDLAAAKSSYNEFRAKWLDVEGGVKDQSATAYKMIEEEMANVSFALLQEPVDKTKVATALQGLKSADERFIQGGYPADGGKKAQASGNVADLVALLTQAKQKLQANDVAGAAAAMKEFRTNWLNVEGVVLTASSKVYGDAEKDMVDTQALLSGANPDGAKALAIIERMESYMSPIAGKTSYNLFDAASIILREGLEALLITVALLAFLKKSGQAHKAGWIWGGVGAGMGVSAALAIAVKFLFGTGAFGNNNFIIMGATGLFAASMMIYMSYWLHSKSSISEWQRYIREKSSAALATGSLFSLATLAFLAVFREGTETVLFYVGMASSIAMRDMLLGLGLGFGILAVLAVAILKLGVKVPMRPFFLVSSLLVFYLAFKFLGMGIHGLQLAGLLRATVVSYLPSIDFLALYPNWESTAPQLLLLLGAVFTALWQQRRDRAAKASLATQH